MRLQSRLLLAIVGIVATLAPAQADPQPCAPGYVHRAAGPGDLVCVTPEARAQAQRENAAAESRRSPGGGAYGPNTCLPGYVWREGFPNDLVCVPPEARSRVASENAHGSQHVAGQQQTPVGQAPVPGQYDVPTGTPGIGRTSFQSDRMDAGIYMLKSTAGLCIGWSGRDNGTTNLSLTPCRNGTAGPLFALVRQSTQAEQAVNPRYSLRPVYSMAQANVGMNGLDCAGEAEGVIAGPAGVDVTPCGVPFAPEVERADLCTRFSPRFGNGGQGIGLEQMTRYSRNPAIYRVRLYASNRCMTTRDGSMDPGAEQIWWDCHDFGADDFLDQLIEFVPVAPLPRRIAACSRS